VYNEQLNNLIEMALMDGELTEKEKQILFKRAESFGVDLDEFEMVLEAKLFEKRQATSANETSDNGAAPTSEKYGDVRKCPACGALVSSFSAKCIDCGHEYDSIEANASIQKLFKMLNDAEDTRKEDVTSINPFSIFGKAMNHQLSHITGPSKVDRKKMEIISNFPVPTTKTDMIEFLALASPKARSIGTMFTKNLPENKMHNDYVPVWKAKCEQIIIKARFALKDDPKTLDEINHYAKELGIK
jgi:hypothetical protein